MSRVLEAPSLGSKDVAQAVNATNTPLDIAQALDDLVEALAATAVHRDREGGHAARERELIRASGLLRLTIPLALGGLGADWVSLLRVVRRLAQVDSALAHVFAFHHLQIASVQLYGTTEQQHRLQQLTAQQHWFWGNASNPRDTRLVATPFRHGWVLDGEKSYASGSVGSDHLLISAHVDGGLGNGPELMIATVPTRAPGIKVQHSWDAFGQRQTDSGTVRFLGVRIARCDVLLAPGHVRTARQSLRTLLSRLIMTNLYTGLAQGALATARRYTLDHARPWPGTGLARVADDAVVQHRYGQLRLLVLPAQLAADAAAERLLSAQQRGAALGDDERGAVALAVAEAKVLAHRAALEVSSQFFELTGAASTSMQHGLDRFWRNARVHTLHDPVDLKLRDIGRHVLDGVFPEPTSYS